MTVCTLVAPLSGRALRLAESPDPAFASGVLGEGLAIDPTEGELRAPCDGTILSPHACGHALTVRADNGAELLIHLGVDTVNMRGAGFTAHVKDGSRVAAGDRLISFDLKAVRAKASSPVSMMVLANGDAFRVVSARTGRPVESGEPVMTIEPVATTANAASSGGESAEISVELRIAHGLHARPAAALAAAAKDHPGPVTVACRGNEANAKSVVALMGLGTRFGDLLTVRIQGAGAEAAADTLLDLILSGLGDPLADGPAPEAETVPERPSQAAEPAQALPPFPPDAPAVLTGRSAVGGLAAGTVTRLSQTAEALPKDGNGSAVEGERLAAARARVDARLAGLAADPVRGAVAAAHREILSDPALLDAAGNDIAAGRSAEWAWNAACGQQARILASLADARMAERAADLKDVSAQVLAALAGRDGVPGLAELPAGTIVLAEEIFPSQMTGLQTGHLAAILMRDGGPTSHAAILAAGIGLPTVVALGAEADRIPDGASIIVDAGTGRVTVHPESGALAAARAQAHAQAGNRAALRAAAQAECRLADGTRVEVFANLGHAGEGVRAVAEGAEGCGLLRSEFLFLDRTTAPDENEQYAEYQAVADELAGRPVIIRTLDVGGDKPLAYLPLPKEENPFLGLRGIRVGLARPELLRAQIRAILRVKPYGIVRIMVPMVASVAEVKAVRAMVEEERQALGRTERIQVGAMVEVPAAAVTAEALAAVCDFFSIGTNDLTQYTLAMDRGNPAVAGGVDALHPGVLGLINLTAKGAATFGRLVAVCGGAASDPLAVPILVGLGVRELSAAPAAIPEVKATLAGMTLAACEDLAKRALAAAGPEEVRALARARAVNR
jgi:multiphosphoryl transfer protein